MTYFGYTAALDDNCGAHAHAGRPCDAWLASSARPRWDAAGNVGLHSNFEGWRRNENGSDHTHWPWRVGEGAWRHHFAHLSRRSVMSIRGRHIGKEVLPNSWKARGPAGTPGIESRRPGAPNILPLLTRLSTARSTSVEMVSFLSHEPADQPQDPACSKRISTFELRTESGGVIALHGGAGPYEDVSSMPWQVSTKLGVPERGGGGGCSQAWFRGALGHD